MFGNDGLPNIHELFWINEETNRIRNIRGAGWMKLWIRFLYWKWGRYREPKEVTTRVEHPKNG